MNLLNLRPLPSALPDESFGGLQKERDGFVDDAVVFSLLAGSSAPRQLGKIHENLALPADDLDFAGWCLSSAPPVRATEIVRARPAPPVIDESGIGVPHQGSHRWWLAGMAGALSTLLISFLLLSLSERNAATDEVVPSATRSQRAISTPVVEQEKQQKFHELTEVLPPK